MQKDVQVQKEKLQERKRAAIKTVQAFTQCSGADAIHQLDALLTKIAAEPTYKALLDEVQTREPSGAAR